MVNDSIRIYSIKKDLISKNEVTFQWLNATQHYSQTFTRKTKCDAFVLGVSLFIYVTYFSLVYTLGGSRSLSNAAIGLDRW